MSSTVVIVGPTPPPIHGASRVTARVVELASAAAGPHRSVLHVSTSGTGWTKSLAYHVSRIAAHLRAGWLLVHRRISGSVTLYVTGAGGLGLAYQAALIGLARVLGCRSVFHHHSWSYLRDGGSAWMRLICRFQGLGDTQIMLSPHMAETFAASYSTAAAVVTVNNAFAVSVPKGLPPARARDVISLIHVSNLSRE